MITCSWDNDCFALVASAYATFFMFASICTTSLLSVDYFHHLVYARCGDGFVFCFLTYITCICACSCLAAGCFLRYHSLIPTVLFGDWNGFFFCFLTYCTCVGSYAFFQRSCLLRYHSFIPSMSCRNEPIFCDSARAADVSACSVLGTGGFRNHLLLNPSMIIMAIIMEHIFHAYSILTRLVFLHEFCPNIIGMPGDQSIRHLTILAPIVSYIPIRVIIKEQFHIRLIIGSIIHNIPRHFRWRELKPRLISRLCNLYFH